jgi:zinc/manganese transport system substrate-binding protein
MMRSVAGNRPAAVLLLTVAAAIVATAVMACSGGPGSPGSPGKIAAVGAESEYADVIRQIGGRYVQVSAIMSNPSTDPHTFEASIAVAREVGGAQLVVQNGLGYDAFMNAIESATPSPGRKVIDVQRLLGLPDSTPNPHLWYAPGTMPKVAAAIAAGLAALQPSHASLSSLTSAIDSFKAGYRGVPAAATEPVADYLLGALGVDNLTPWTFQADVMNGVDPPPQSVAAERALLAQRKVKVLVYNQQVTDPLTRSLTTLAAENHIPVVGVYETMPAPGYDYQTWMLTEVRDLREAVAAKVSPGRRGGSR